MNYKIVIRIAQAAIGCLPKADFCQKTMLGAALASDYKMVLCSMT